MRKRLAIFIKMIVPNINKRGKLTKTEYIYESIRRDIASGNLNAEEKLASKRELSEQLKVSVMTVENAYAMLEEEGYIYSIPRKGFFVSKISAREDESKNAWKLKTLREEEGEKTDGVISVQGLPKIIRRILSDQPDIMLRKPPHSGCAVLKNAIAQYLYRFRGMQVQPANVIIGSGAEYLYSLIVQMFGPDVVYGIEYPSYEKIEKVYLSNGAKIDRLKMGNDGIETDALKKTKAKVLHVTPFHSYPTRITASLSKRNEYLKWSKEKRGYIIEDDYDSEIAFFKKPISTLYSIDTAQRIIYMNTFSKSISPGMRVAYMVLPDELLKKFSDRLGFYSCTVPVFDQYVLAAFINDGGFERHLRRVRKQLKNKDL